MRLGGAAPKLLPGSPSLARSFAIFLSDLRELKVLLEIDPTDAVEDVKLGLLLEVASSWIQECLGRDLENRSRTEYYDGTGTQTLPLRQRPVFTNPNPAVSIDESGYFGAPAGSFAAGTALTYGTDFVVDVDQDDGSSRAGMLVRVGGVWPRAVLRRTGLLTPYRGRAYGSIKVTYTAGYTVETLPPMIRTACNLLVARMRDVLPLGVESTQENFQERTVSVVTNAKTRLLELAWPLLLPYRNWTW